MHTSPPLSAGLGEDGAGRSSRTRARGLKYSSSSTRPACQMLAANMRSRSLYVGPQENMDDIGNALDVAYVRDYVLSNQNTTASAAKHYPSSPLYLLLSFED